MDVGGLPKIYIEGLSSIYILSRLEWEVIVFLEMNSKEFLFILLIIEVAVEEVSLARIREMKWMFVVKDGIVELYEVCHFGFIEASTDFVKKIFEQAFGRIDSIGRKKTDHGV